MARINSSPPTSALPLPVEKADLAPPQGETTSTVRTPTAEASNRKNAASLNTLARNRARIRTLSDATARKETKDSGYASGNEGGTRPSSSASMRPSLDEAFLSADDGTNLPTPSDQETYSLSDLRTIPDWESNAGENRSALAGTRFARELLHEDSLSGAESVVSLALSNQTIPSINDLESIPDWGSVLDSSRHNIEIEGKQRGSPALDSIKAACDVNKGTNDMVERARTLETHMEAALIAALRSGDAESVSYLRQQMYYMGDRKRCRDIIISASQHLPGIESKENTATLREFIHLLSYRTSPEQREPVLKRIRERCPANDLAHRFQSALRENDASDITALRMLMLELSLPLHTEHLNAIAEQLPDAVRQGHHTAIEAIASLLQPARGEAWYGAAINEAAKQCLAAAPASLAGIIRGFTLLATGLNRTSLEQVLTTLASSLPYEKSEGSVAAMHAFGDALDQHAGQLDNAARERLLAAFDTRTKPRKTGSPVQLPAWRRSERKSDADKSAKLEFTEARRAVRIRLKFPRKLLSQAFTDMFAKGKAGTAAPR